MVCLLTVRLHAQQPLAAASESSIASGSKKRESDDGEAGDHLGDGGHLLGEGAGPLLPKRVPSEG